MIHRRTLLSGAVLGVALLSALTVAGIMGAKNSPKPSSPLPPRDTDTLTALQPQLREALLKPADLPSPYATASKATVRRVSPVPERCAALLDPNSLLREVNARMQPRPETTDQASAQLDGPTQLTQLLTTFAGDGAATTLNELRTMGQGCRDFQAVLDDGKPVRVNSVVVRDEANIYSVKLTITGADRITSGYVTLGRVGQVLSVLNELGPAESLDPVRLVDLTLNRLTQGR